jgi:hypothetical protein
LRADVIKTATSWLFFGAYFLLLFAVHSWWLIVPLAVVMGLGWPRSVSMSSTRGAQAYSTAVVNKSWRSPWT